MATATSLLHRTLRGAIGDLIFRNYNGKTVVSVRPVYKNETNTEARRQARGKFRDASGYASNAMEDKKLKAYYTQKARQLKLPNAYTAAITDYLRKARAKVMTPSSFAAKKGEVLNLWLRKSGFEINKVKAILCDHQGQVLYEQNLTKPSSQYTFDFVLPDDYPGYAKLKIITNEPLEREYVVKSADFSKLII